MSEKVREPRLRFRGFENEWKIKKLSSITSIHARIGWQNLRTSEFLKRGQYLLITGTDFKNGKVSFKNCFYVSKYRYDQDEKIQVKNGNVLVTKDGTLGKVAYVEGLNIPATLNAGVFNITVNDKEINSNYLFHFLRAPFLMRYAKMNATGGTIKHLNQGILVNFPVQLSSINEQLKISSFLNILDRMINLQQDKIEHLRRLKKGYLQKMFTDDHIPRLRFNGFNDNWRKNKLGKLFKISTGRSKYEKNVQKNPVYKYPVLGSSSVISWSNEYDYSGNFVLIGRVGAAGVINRYNGKAKISDNTIFLNCEDSNFIFNLLKTVNLKRLVFGSTQPLIKSSDLNNKLIYYPSLTEQTQVGHFFQILDHQISLSKSKLETLKKTKQAYLQKMFI